MSKKAVEDFKDEDVNDGEPVHLVGIDAHVMATSDPDGVRPEGSNYPWGAWVKIDSSPVTNPPLEKEALHELNLPQTWDIAVGVVREDGTKVQRFAHTVHRGGKDLPVIVGDIGTSPINVRAVNHYARTQGRVLTLQFAKAAENDRQWYAEATPVVGNIRGNTVTFTVS